LTCSTCEILGPNFVNHYLVLVSFVEISKNNKCKSEWSIKITCTTARGVRILLDTPRNSHLFYSGIEADKQGTVNCIISKKT